MLLGFDDSVEKRYTIRDDVIWIYVGDMRVVRVTLCVGGMV